MEIDQFCGFESTEFFSASPLKFRLALAARQLEQQYLLVSYPKRGIKSNKNILIGPRCFVSVKPKQPNTVIIHYLKL